MLLSFITLGNILFIRGYHINIYTYIIEYTCIYIFVHPLEIINIPCTQGDKIYIYTYIREHDENLLNIFLMCCSKPSADLSKSMNSTID